MTTQEGESRRQRRQRKMRRRRIVVAAAVPVALTIALLLAFVVVPGSGGPRRSGHHSRGEKAQATTTTTTDATFAGADGTEASWVVKENERPGTTAWRITGQAGGIDGYLSAVQATDGQRVTLYVSTSAPTWTVTAYRMGYYGGDGGRQVWQSSSQPGAVQPSCPVTSGVNMVECSWAPSLPITVDSTWVQGDYLLKLVGSGGQQSYVPLTVWDPSSHATYLVQNDVLTWQAWNTYGGYDFYQGTGACPPGSPTYPPCNRARVVSFDRPYSASFGDGAADFLSEEYPLGRFMEEHGLDVTYGTDITTDEDPGGLLDHRAFLSLGHDEQWSLPMRDAAQSALSRGVNLAFFGASPVLRKVRLQASPLGPDREEVNYRNPAQDPELTVDPSEVSQNSWDQAPADWPPSALVASTYFGFGGSFPLVVTDPGAWLYKGTGLVQGDTVPGVIASDFNGYTAGNGEPPGVEILAHSPVKPAGGRAGSADTVYYTSASSLGGVFSSGTNGWIPAMAPCDPATPANACPAIAVQQMTANLLALFGQGPAGSVEPSSANWQQYYP